MKKVYQIMINWEGVEVPIHFSTQELAEKFVYVMESITTKKGKGQIEYIATELTVFETPDEISDFMDRAFNLKMTQA